MSSSAMTAMNGGTKASKSPLWHLVQKNGPSLQEQIDASHQKCRTDWKMSESIIASLFKDHRREIMRLKGADNDEEMADDDEDDDNTAEISKSPLWDCVQGAGPCFQEQLDASHDKCRAERQIQESIMASELKSLRLEVTRLKEKNARQEERLMKLEKKDDDHYWNWKYFIEFRNSLKLHLSTLWVTDVVPMWEKSSLEEADKTRNRLSRFEKKDFWRQDKTVRTLKQNQAAEESQSGDAVGASTAWRKILNGA